MRDADRYHRQTIYPAFPQAKRIMKSSHPVRTALAFLTIAGFLAACEVETFDDAAGGFGGGSPPPTTPPPTGGSFGPNFSEIQSNVFTPTCATSTCHAGAGPAAGLNLEAANSYAQLVGVASSQDAAILRVAAGNPDNSYLIQKLEGTAASGQQMPAGGTPLPQTDIDVVRQWVTDGAIDDTVPSTAPIRVASLMPMPGAALTVAPAQIIAGFDRNPDASTVNANTFILEASGGDGTFADNNEVQIMAASISVPAANMQTAVFDLTGVALADDTYRVSLLGSGASLIMDQDANALDGEFVAAFPSGDGTAGGDFQAEFTLSTPVVLGPTLDQIQAVVFTPSCATVGCHTGVAPAAGLDLSTADLSFAGMVNVPSTQVVTTMMVAPMDPNNSYLIQKIEMAVPPVGGVMPPPPAAMLDAAVIAEIRQWITDGALR